MRRSEARLRTIIIAALLAALPVLPSFATGTAGNLDPSFGTGGRVIGTFYGWASAVALQLDGKIVVAGTADVKPGKFGFALVRYNPDGTLDSSFGRNGKVTTGFGDGAEVTAVVVQSDGKIVAAGRSGPTGEGSRFFALARYLTDGTLDRSFGRRGKVTTDFLGGENGIADLVLQPDGKIVAGGWASTASALVFRFAVARYRTDGTLDRSFGSGGKVTTKLRNGSAGLAALALQHDGKILAGGSTRGDIAVVRYRPDGTVDPSFGTGGRVFTDFGRGDGLSDLVVQLDGKILAGGATTPRGGSPNESVFALARYRPDGRLDPRFGSRGKVTTDLPGTLGTAALALQPDGEIVAVGTVTRPALRPSSRLVVARYNVDGQLDPGFGVGGVVTTAFRGESGAADVVLQTDGRIVVVGSTASRRSGEFPFWSYFIVARYLAT